MAIAACRTVRWGRRHDRVDVVRRALAGSLGAIPLSEGRGDWAPGAATCPLACPALETLPGGGGGGGATLRRPRGGGGGGGATLCRRRGGGGGGGASLRRQIVSWPWSSCGDRPAAPTPSSRRQIFVASGRSETSGRFSSSRQMLFSDLSVGPRVPAAVAKNLSSFLQRDPAGGPWTRLGCPAGSGSSKSAVGPALGARDSCTESSG